MENPFNHTLAMNIIGRVLDEDRNKSADSVLNFSSLEARIAHTLEQAGLLTPKAFEVVGLAGRYGHPEKE